MSPLLTFIYTLLRGGPDVSQTWALEFAGAVDITKPPYNADSTGVVDVTTALNQAVTDGYKLIRFKTGTYKYGSITLQGPIDYYYAEDGWRWRPSYDTGGYMEALLNITSTSLALSAQHFGHLLQFDASAEATLTIGAGIIPQIPGSLGTNKASGYWFIVKSGPYGVLLSPGTGVTMYRSGSAVSVTEYYVPGGGSSVLVSYVWTSTSTSRVDVFPLNIVADRSSIYSREDAEVIQLGDAATISVDYVTSGLTTANNRLNVVGRVIHARNSGAGTGGVNLTLPAVTASPAPEVGTAFYVRNRTADGSLVTLTAGGSSTVNGMPLVQIAPGGSAWVEAVEISGSTITWSADGDLAGDIVLDGDVSIDGSLVVNGELVGQSVPAVAVTANTTVTQLDSNKTFVVTASATVTVPDTFRGRVFVRNNHTTSITVTVAGAGSYSLPSGRGLAVECVAAGATVYRHAAEITYVSLV